MSLGIDGSVKEIALKYSCSVGFIVPGDKIENYLFGKNICNPINGQAIYMIAELYGNYHL